MKIITLPSHETLHRTVDLMPRQSDATPVNVSSKHESSTNQIHHDICKHVAFVISMPYIVIKFQSIEQYILDANLCTDRCLWSALIGLGFCSSLFFYRITVSVKISKIYTYPSTSLIVMQIH